MNSALAIIFILGLALLFFALHRAGGRSGRLGYAITLPALAGWCLILVAVLLWIIREIAL